VSANSGFGITTRPTETLRSGPAALLPPLWRMTAPGPQPAAPFVRQPGAWPGTMRQISTTSRPPSPRGSGRYPRRVAARGGVVTLGRGVVACRRPSGPVLGRGRGRAGPKAPPGAADPASGYFAAPSGVESVAVSVPMNGVRDVLRRVAGRRGIVVRPAMMPVAARNAGRRTGTMRLPVAATHKSGRRQR
jgi:hypothetical protein